jgi:hypothetical protein
VTADALIEEGARRLEEISARLGNENGLKARLREELQEDAAFLRKLKPSAIAARAHGEVPREDLEGATTTITPPRPREPASRRKPSGGGPNPLVVIAAAFAVGYVLAKVVDWRGHAHPRL